MAAYNLIQTQTLTVATAVITFSLIPQTYTDLRILCSVRSAATSANVGNYDPMGIQFNATTSGYSGREGYGNGSSATASTTLTTMTAFNSTTVGRINETGINNNNSTANVYSSVEIYIPNYAGSTYKTFNVDYYQEQNQTANNIGFNGSLWSNTAAITSVDLFLKDANYMIYSSFSLYGIKNN